MPVTNPQKAACLDALSNERGVIAALAMDQRRSLRKMLDPQDPSLVTDDHVVEFKTAVARHLSTFASAMLLDPEFGLPAAATRAKSCGLLLTYESDGFENPRPHRMLQLMPEFSVRRLAELGAQGIKILLSWAPGDDRTANNHKRALIERIGAECETVGIPFFLEPVVYDPFGLTAPDPAFLKQKADWVTRTMEEFSDSRYLVDVLKVEFPVNASAVQSGVFTKAEALDWFRRSDAASRVPYIYLSAGVSNDEFTNSLELAAEAGARYSGVLCGRANWQGGVTAYRKTGVEGLSEWLVAEGSKNMDAVNAALRSAVGWRER